MRPLPGRSERGIAHLTIKPRGRDSINALAIGLTLDPNDPSGKTAYGLRLSRRSCSAIRRNPADPGYVSGLLASAEYFASSGAASWQGPVTLDSKTTRAARSMVLIGMGDGSVRQLVACGKGYKVEFSDVIISS